ncbi:glutathione S-transferase family protein [Pelistega europaea]|uniref:Glutathione S-transferase family protein n=1 Tax=Pelistega europaea TaxID=106147 RepID=A0A7Y4L804_9BURK|nr:glutathione S-transferase family protein [Pelistega europaea]NOL48578.1 glutathione S-transferase family protein [Pelistega europaea]
MQLFFSPASPYVRKVLITAYERHVINKIKILSSSAHPIHRDLEIVKQNSSGKVPCAILPNNQALFDSRVICQYIDKVLANEGPSLYPETQYFEILTLEALGDSILDACLLCRYENILRPKDLFWETWYNAQMEKIDSGLNDLENKWFPLLDSQHFHAGCIATAATLGYLDFRFSNKDWRVSHPKLAMWFQKISDRESIKNTTPHD